MSAANPPRTIAAIPVFNEAERIAACLEALDNQLGAQLDGIVLLLNNCTDASATIARGTPLRPGTVLHAIECTLPPAQSNAGHARRRAMQAAAELAGPDGVLLTTDADGRVDPDWLAATLIALAAGADAVAGWVELDPVEWSAIPQRLHEDDARECAYDSLCDAIHAWLDPDPADPLPRHTQNSGASIAVTVAAYTAAGGMPDIPAGEDRAFIAALRRAGARIRHANAVHVVVSGRTEGRCVGGMADTIRRRLSQPDDVIDDRLEPAADCARRAALRALLRRAWSEAGGLDRLAYGLGRPEIARLCAGRTLAEAWDRIEAMLLPGRQTVRAADLARETAAAQAILAAMAVPADRSGSPQPAFAASA